MQGYHQQQQPDFNERYIHIEKTLLFRTTTAKGNPEGLSVLRRVYRPYYICTRVENNEAIGIERELAGLPKGEIPSEFMAPDAPAEKKAL